MSSDRMWHRIGKGAAVAAAWVMLAPVAALGQARVPEQSSGVVDYLGVPGPIDFAGSRYHLAWSSRPTPSYIKHEYVPAGQRPEAYQDMVMVELVTSGAGVEHALSAQTAMLERRKAQDPVARYDILRNPANKQVILDFLISDESTGRLILEWNAYRYVSVAMPGGGKGLMLFAISRRHYGGGEQDFLKALKTRRAEDIDALARHAVPGAEPAP